MTDKDQLEQIASLLKVTSEQIDAKVRVHRRGAISKLYARTKPFWIKARADLSLSENDYLINLRNEFPDIWQLRYLKTGVDQGAARLEFMSEGRFMKQYPDDTATGVPRICIPLDANYIQLYPRLNADMTLYASYYWQPALNTIDGIPEIWQDHITDYIVAMLWPDTTQKVTLLQLWSKGLDDAAAMAKPIVEDDIDIESDPLTATIGSIMLEEL